MEKIELARQEFKKIENQAIEETSIPQHYYEKGFIRACELLSAEINKLREEYDQMAFSIK